MKNRSLINKIKSSYIIKNIFNYIPDPNLQLKLFIYSKYFQKLLNLSLIYKEKYINKIGFNMTQYLHVESKNYKEDYLIKRFDNFLLEKKLNKEEFENIISDILVNKEIKENTNKLIDIESPLFEIISKTKSFENNYTIYISQKIIDKFKLKDNYKIYFDKLNKLNIKYSSIYCTFDDINKISYLIELNIDFNKIKRISLIEERNNKEEKKEKYLEDNKNFFGTLFSIKNIENSLIYLKIIFSTASKLEPILFEKINDFKLLRYLYIEYLHFVKKFTIKLENITKLSFINCKNITISKTFCIKIEILNLRENEISNINILENDNFKELKKIDLSQNKILDIKILEKVKFEKLEILNLQRNKIINIDILENVNFKELKELNLSFNEISEIKY